MKAKSLMLVALILTVPGCASVRGGRLAFDGDAAGPTTNGASVDYEQHFGYLTRDTRFDLSARIGVTFFLNDTGIPASDGDAFPSDGLSLSDLGLVSRFYPFGHRTLTPYVGGGLSWFRVFDTFKKYTGTCTSGPGWTCRTYVYEQETLGSGIYRQWHVGLLVPVAGNTSLVVEARKDGGKEGGGFLLDGTTILLGLRLGAGR